MMWNSLLDNAKKVADKAKAAAENLEGQLNESVGATPDVLASASSRSKESGKFGGGAGGTGSLFNTLGRGFLNAMSHDEDDEEDDDGFFDDDPFYEEDIDFDMHDKDKAETQSNNHGNDSQVNTMHTSEPKLEDEKVAHVIETREGVDEESTTVLDSVTDSIPATDSSVDDESNIEDQTMMQYQGTEERDEQQGESDNDNREDTVEFSSEQKQDHDTIYAVDEHINPTENNSQENVVAEMNDNAISATVHGEDALNEEQNEINHVASPNDNQVDDQCADMDLGADKRIVANIKHKDDDKYANCTPHHDITEMYDDVDDEEAHNNITNLYDGNVIQDDEVIRDEEDVQHEVGIQDEENIYDEEDIQGERGIEDEENIQDEEDSQDEEKFQDEENIEHEEDDQNVADSLHDEQVIQDGTIANHAEENFVDKIPSNPFDDQNNIVSTKEEDKQIENNVTLDDASAELDRSPLDSDATIPRVDSDSSIYVSKEEMMSQENNASQAAVEKLNAEIVQLKSILAKREYQLTAKAEQMSSMIESHEKEKSILESKVRETKEEAKKRISKAKEKVESMQAKLSAAVARADSVGSSSTEQDEIIQALRKEGENLAMKQSKMEELVRDARSELRDVQDELETQTEAKIKALSKIDELNQQLEKTKLELSSARDGQGRAEKLDSDLLVEREEREKNASKILSLEATIKEMKKNYADMLKDMETKMNSQVAKMESEKSTIGKEKDNLIKDLELKLRTSEKESNLREDSLRHEVSELRKRWQESVRRSDALSIDLQQSSAPLMRQLESAERQSRARSSAWAELESKLRADLEENIIQNENLKKEKCDMDAELKRLNRGINDRDSELSLAQSKIAELNDLLESTNAEYEKAVIELEQIKDEFTTFKSLVKENESKIRNEVMINLKETDERYNDHIESLEVDLRQEKEKRLLLEEKIKEFNTNLLPTVNNGTANIKPKKRSLGGKDNQANILQSTLFGLSGTESDNEDETETSPSENGGVQESFAFIEQLSQALKAAKNERETLRTQLLDSEENLRRQLMHSEEKTSELIRLNQEKDLEIEGLNQDIYEVRQMYRSQLDALLEEKTSGHPPVAGAPKATPSDSANKKPSLQPSPQVPRYGMMPHF